MKVIPAIDIKGGKVVRLTQGLADRQTVYSDSPIEVAEKWAALGVELIHVVDLDGAMTGRLVNLAIIERIAKNIKPRIELGGGIRDEAAVKLVLDSGIDKAVIGTKALDKKFIAKVAKRFRNRIIVALDARDNFVRTEGWVSQTRIKISEFLDMIETSGIKTINYTDISKDGMLEGPNIEHIKAFLKATDLDVVAAGGISSLEDVRRLKALEKDGLKGMIIGKALYENKIDLADAIEICKEQSSGNKGKTNADQTDNPLS